MHEFAICQNIVDAVINALSEVKASSFRLKKVRIVVGKYHQIVAENLEFAFDVLVKETAARGAKLEIKTLPIVVRCEACGWEGEIQLPMFLCGGCGSGRVEITGGRELYLEDLEVETDE